MIVSWLWIAAASVSVTVEPETETPVALASGVPFWRTVNALAAGVDPVFSGSSKVATSEVPSTVALPNAGPVVSTMNERELE